jgi:trans-2,3-dihydro-3-hydroxyanthranilate isomerase
MSNRYRFFITNVFGESRYSGNQLATFLNAASITAEEMQQITREIYFSETTFVLHDKQRDGGYDVRIFTPAEEINFAGHPTLGTAYIIRKHLISESIHQVILNLKVGHLLFSKKRTCYGCSRHYLNLAKPLIQKL